MGHNKGGRGRPHVRLRLGFLGIAIALSVFAARLLQLQGFDPGSYAEAAAKEDTVTVTLPAQRGEILDRNGEALADSLDGEMIVADPALTTDNAAALATLLATRLKLDYFSTLQKLEKPGSRFQYIARHVPAADATAAVDAADKAGYSGLSTERDPIRDYPQGQVAANLVGFVGTDTPLAGLELNFNKELSGTDGSATYEVGTGSDSARIPLGRNSETPAVNGQNLTLTIDSELQFYAQKLLDQAVQQHHADGGIAAVMDTRSGQLLTLADSPTYDASDPSAAPSSDRGAPSLTTPYEPGSVEKTLTLSAAIDAGYITDRTKVTVPPMIMSGGHAIHDWFPHGTIHTTSAGVVAQSLNLGTIELSKKFKKGQLRRYLTSFGLGKKTNIGVPGESSGVLPTDAQWSQSLQDRIDFGQSLSVNAVQMLAAVNTIANGGVYVAPSLIMGKATTNTGQVVGTAETTTHRVISTNAAHQMDLMMQRVTDPTVGVGGKADIKGYLVAGKTGTAQEVDPKTGLYSSLYTVSFMGFAPADNPRFTVYVVLKSPRDGASGGGGAGPIFQKIMSFALRRYGVPTSTAKPSTLPAYIR